MTTSERAPTLETLDLLILARMLKSCSAASACKDVGRLAAAHLGPGEWTALFDTHWKRLVEAGLIGFPPRKKRGQTFVLTDAGRQRALAFLGVADVAANVTWPKLQSDYLFPLAMNLEPGSSEAARLRTSAPLSLAILSREKNIPPRAGATAKSALATVAWKLIGVETEAAFSAENVIQHFALKRTPKKMTGQQVVTALAAVAVGSSKTGAADLRAAAVRKWLVSTPVKATPAPNDDLEEFACGVIEAARRCPAAARFGENKVFISHVWRQLDGDPAASGAGFDQFKRRLVQANREGLLHLSRADLVEAMNPIDVRESATMNDNATFHFVRI